MPGPSLAVEDAVCLRPSSSAGSIRTSKLCVVGNVGATALTSLQSLDLAYEKPRCVSGIRLALPKNVHDFGE